jgi:hypothetical protein
VRSGKKVMPGRLVPEVSISDTDSIHSDNEGSGNQDHRPEMPDKMDQESTSLAQ